MPVTLTPAQLATLKADMLNGPLKAQIAPLIHANPVAIASLYANPAGPAAANITMQYAQKSDVLLTVETAIVALASATSAIQTKWAPLTTPLLLLLTAAPGPFKKTDIASLPALVGDSLLTQAQADAPWTRIGAYGEVLLGEGVFPTSDDIQAASELA